MRKLPGWKTILYSLLCTCADMFNAVLSAFPQNVEPDDMPLGIEEMTDEEVLALEKTPVSLDPLCCHTFWLGEGLVMKEVLQFDQTSEDCHEANALNIVRLQTSIPVPRVRRVIQLDKESFFIVMDRVKGMQLSEVWNTLSIWKKVSVALQLRRYITQLRRFTKSSLNTPAGPISVLGPRMCHNPRIFGQTRPTQGPFQTHTELVAYCNNSVMGKPLVSRCWQLALPIGSLASQLAIGLADSIPILEMRHSELPRPFPRSLSSVARHWVFIHQDHGTLSIE